MIYLDTSCLVKLYYPEPESESIARLVADQPIALTALHELEFTNALELKRFRKEATVAQVKAAHAALEADTKDGVHIRTPIEWNEAWRDARSQAKALSHDIGCRSLDILHCVLAVQASIATFITTDERQRRAARKLGLRCPIV